MVGTATCAHRAGAGCAECADHALVECVLHASLFGGGTISEVERRLTQRGGAEGELGVFFYCFIVSTFHQSLPDVDVAISGTRTTAVGSPGKRTALDLVAIALWNANRTGVLGRRNVEPIR